MQETQVWSLGREDPLEKETATHSSVLAWEIPWMEEPRRLQSMGSQKRQTRLSDWTATRVRNTSGEGRVLPPFTKVNDSSQIGEFTILKKKKKSAGDTVKNTSDMALAYVLAEATEMKDITT